MSLTQGQLASAIADQRKRFKVLFSAFILAYGSVPIAIGITAPFNTLTKKPQIFRLEAFDFVAEQ